VKWKPLIDSSVNLTSDENQLIYDAIDVVVRKIVKREKSPLKRRLLRHCIVLDAELSANAAFGDAEKRLWRRVVRENTKKEKKLSK
jgi:ribosome-associated translation inhibitor RaiA